MNSFQCDGVYGSLDTPCQVYVHDGWYVVEGSVNVNRAPYGGWHHWASDGYVLPVESVADIDTFTWSSPIETLAELVLAVEH